MNRVVDGGKASVNVHCGSTVAVVDALCYLEDVLNADGCADVAVLFLVWCGWNKFRQLPFLTAKGRLKGTMYSRYVRSCILHGSEPWSVRRRMNYDY